MNQRDVELLMGAVGLLVLLAMLKVMLHFGHFTT
jgi:hypothetical protein